MKKSDPAFQETMGDAVDSLMAEFIAWNDIQRELHAGGYTSNYYAEEEMPCVRSAFTVIAERFVLEDVDFKEWEWFETPWVGADGNTGNIAYVIDFVRKGVDEPEFGVLGFYVTRNHRCWYALPLAEEVGENVSVYAVNSIGAALGILEGLNPDDKPAGRETTHSE